DAMASSSPSIDLPGFSSTLQGPPPVALGAPALGAPASAKVFVVPPAASTFDMLQDRSLPSMPVARAAPPAPAPAPAAASSSPSTASFGQGDTLMGPLPPMRVIP